MAKKKYREDFPERAERLAEKGYIDKEIAHKLGISEETFYNYMKEYPEFFKAVKRGKEKPDLEVERALLKSAKGHEYEKVTEEFDSESKLIRRRVELMHVEPNVKANIFWLTNRKGDEWKNRKEHEISGKIEVVEGLAEMTVDELKEQLARLENDSRADKE